MFDKELRDPAIRLAVSTTPAVTPNLISSIRAGIHSAPGDAAHDDCRTGCTRAAYVWKLVSAVCSEAILELLSSFVQSITSYACIMTMWHHCFELL